MHVAFGMLLFFGGPLALLVGLVRPSIYPGGRLGALGIGFLLSLIGLGGAMATLPADQWQAIQERSARARLAQDAQRAREDAQRAEMAAAREEQRRAQLAREQQERVAAEARVEEARRAAEQARRQAEAAAAEHARRPDRVRPPQGAGGEVVVWRNSAAMREAMQLINANVHRTNPTLLLPHIACMLPAGTEIVVTDGGFFSSEVLVVAGRLSGCRGIVENEWIDRR